MIKENLSLRKTDIINRRMFVIGAAKIIIFGGKGSKTTFRDLHALDPVTMTWYQGPEGGGAPSARFDHSSNLVGGTKMIVFGGWNG